MQICHIHEDNPECAEITEEVVVIIRWFEVAFGASSNQSVLNIELMQDQKSEEET